MPVCWSKMSCILFCLQWKKFQNQQKMKTMAWRERRSWVSFKFWKGWRKSPICRSAGEWHEFNNVSNKASNFETSDFRHLFFWSEKESVLSSIKVENLLRPDSLVITVHTCTVHAIKIEQCKGYNCITPDSLFGLFRVLASVSGCGWYNGTFLRLLLFVGATVQLSLSENRKLTGGKIKIASP